MMLMILQQKPQKGMKKAIFYLQMFHSLGFLFGTWNLLIFSSFQAVNSVLRQNFCYFLTWELDALKSNLPYSTEFRLQKMKDHAEVNVGTLEHLQQESWKQRFLILFTSSYYSRGLKLYHKASMTIPVPTLLSYKIFCYLARVQEKSTASSVSHRVGNTKFSQTVFFHRFPQSLKIFNFFFKKKK